MLYIVEQRRPMPQDPSFKKTTAEETFRILEKRIRELFMVVYPSTQETLTGTLTLEDLLARMDYLQLGLQYILFDSEATGRENAQLRKMLENTAEGDDI
ncbi:hypothetical protein KW782_02105 [Candidatus Parcubacteria bacterium]|nr:hypothetical protein [Candidatus Parcubacteria bacterium]